MPRARGSTQEEAVGLPLRPDRYKALWVGFLHWMVPNDTGGKRDTGRIRITTFKEDFNKNPFDRDDPTRFNVFARFVVIDPPEHTGKMISMGINLKKFQVDPLGQAWGYSFSEDSSWWHKMTRLLHAAGFQFIHDETTEWMIKTDDFLGEMTSAEHLWLPTPTQVEMSHHGLTGDPLPGVTRELLLMGVEAQVADQPPVVEFTTYLTSPQYGARKLKILHDSVVPVAPAEAGVLWQRASRDGELMGLLNKLTYARRSRIASPISTATLGMPGYEQVNDLASQPIPFTSDEIQAQAGDLTPIKTPAQEEAQRTLQDHINFMVGMVDDPDLRKGVWEIITQALSDESVAIVDGVGFHSIPFPVVEAVFFAIVERVSNHFTEGLPSDGLLTPEQFATIKAGLSSLSSFAEEAYLGLVRDVNLSKTEATPPPPPESRM